MTLLDQSEAVTYVPWSAMSPDLNPIEHIWDMLGRRLHAREPPVKKIKKNVNNHNITRPVFAVKHVHFKY
jgi:hypothetical protein